jgi:protein arginine N-methyltransferase 1
MEAAAPTPMVMGGTASADTTTGGTSADYYFNSYAHFGIHEEMLKDTVRTRTYMKCVPLSLLPPARSPL